MDIYNEFVDGMTPEDMEAYVWQEMLADAYADLERLSGTEGPTKWGEYVRGEMAQAETKNTVREDGAKASIYRTQNMSWEEQIDGALYGGKNIRRNDTLVVCNSAETSAAMDIGDKPLVIPLSVLTKASNGRDVSHSIKKGKLAKLDEGIRNAPVTIVNPERNAVVFVTNIKQGGLPIVVSFDLDANFDGDNVHKATSIHLQVDVQTMLENLPASATVYAKRNELDSVGATNNLRGLAAKIKFTGDNVAQQERDVKQSFSFAGEDAMTADEAALQIAKDMLDSGEDMETIRQETGWYQDLDGQWQYDDGELRWAGNETMLETEADAEYTGNDEDLGIRGDRMNMPDSSREWSVFNRSFANKTMGMKHGEQRIVTIFTATNMYHITADGYMRGYAEEKISLDEVQAERRKDRKERANGVDTNRRTVDRWIDAVRSGRGGTGRDLSFSENRRATMEDDRLSDGTSERNRAGDSEGDAEDHQGIDFEEYPPGSLVYDGQGKAYQADESGNLTELAIDERENVDKPRFSMAGEDAMTADEAALQIAKDMLDSGEDMETIRRETGWYQNLDGQWQFDNGELHWAGNETMLETETDAEYTKAISNTDRGFNYDQRGLQENSIRTGKRGRNNRADRKQRRNHVGSVPYQKIGRKGKGRLRKTVSQLLSEGESSFVSALKTRYGIDELADLLYQKIVVEGQEMPSIEGFLPGVHEAIMSAAAMVEYDIQQGNGNAAWTQERLEQLYNTYGKGGNTAYAIRLSPDEFLSLTATKDNAAEIEMETATEYGNLDESRLRSDANGIMLVVDMNSGAVMDHDGRHRMLLLRDEGIDNVPVLIVPYEQNNAATRTIQAMTLRGEEWSYGSAPGVVEVKNIMPFTEQNRTAIQENFAGDADIRFSVAGVEADHIVRTDDMTDEQYAELDARWQSRTKADRSRGITPLDELIVPKERFTSTPNMEKLGIRIDGSVARYRQTEQLRAYEKAAKQSQKMYRERIKALNVGKQELELARGLVEGWLTPGALEGSRFDIDVIAEIADYMAAAQSFSENMISQRRSEINEANARIAEELFQDSEAFSPKLKRLGGLTKIVMNERTPERVVKQIFGAEVGGRIYETYFRPVWVNGAEMYRFENRMLDRVKMFEDQNGVKRKLTKKEREFAQRLMEGKAVLENMARLEPDARQRVEAVAQNVNNGQDFVDAVREWDLYEEYHQGIAQAYADYMDTVALSKDMDRAIMDNAIREYQAIYNEFYDAINDFLVSHGYSEIGFIKGYAPHFQKQEVQQGLFGALKKMGVEKESVSQLPADIAGRTADFKPNMRWNPHAQTRKGSKTDYDIQVGFERYLHYAAEMFYHTDDVMRVRQAVNWFRQQYSSKEISSALEEAQADRYKTAQWKKDFLIEKELVMPGSDIAPREVDALYDEYVGELYARAAPEKLSKYSEFVTWLDNYANILAGKQSLADRGLEYGGGREALNLGSKIMRVFAASNVAGNVSSVLNQSAQLPLLQQQLGTYLERAVYDLARGRAAKEHFAERSDFLTDKRGVDKLTMDNREKFITTLFKPAEWMDRIVSTLAVRGRYLQALDEGMTPEQAMKAADDFGRRVMGSRMKGAKPLGFESKRFINQMIHVFQLEASNTFDYMMLSDIPQSVQQVAKNKGKFAAARHVAAYAVGYLLAAFLLNRLTDEVYGGTPAPFDLIGWALNFVASGFGEDDNEFLLKVIDGGWEKLFDSRPFGTEPLEEESGIHWAGSVENLGYNVLNDVPYVRNVAGVLGLGDQSMPTVGFNEVADDLGDAGKTLWNQIMDGEEETGLDWAGAAHRIGEDILYALSGIMPGGRQVKKTYQGTKAMVQGAKISGHGDNERMQYPIERSGWNSVRAGLFGVSALDETDEFYAAELSGLTAGQTQKVRELEEEGIDRFVTYDLYQQFREINAELSGVDAGTAKRNAINALPLTDQQKFRVFDVLMLDQTADNYEKTCDEYQAMLDVDLTWDEITRVHNYYADLDADEELKETEKATALAKFVDENGWNEAQQTALEARFKFWQMIPVDAGRYEKFVDAGLNSDVSAELVEALNEAKEELGDLEDYEEYRIVVDACANEREAMTALSAILKEGQFAKLEIATEYGVGVDDWVSFKERCAGETTQDAVEAVLDQMRISDRAKAALWQICNISYDAGKDKVGGWSHKNNPYGENIGWQIKEKYRTWAIRKNR